jgi:hypothetical protein
MRKRQHDVNEQANDRHLSSALRNHGRLAWRHAVPRCVFVLAVDDYRGLP